MTVEEAAAAIREHDAVRPRGGGTKLGWSPRGDAWDLDTRPLNRILEHNEGDFTAVLEAGVPLVEAQAAFGAAGQMLALDPPLGTGATIGGVMATNDSGPLRHRYGGVRDLVVGVTVVLSDGTIAKSGGKVIKNVAGYDLAKLFAGSFGTLGLIARVALRLHPSPVHTATVTAATDDPAALAGAAARLAALPLEADSLDVSWRDGSGRLDLRFGGATARERAHAAREHVGLDTGLDEDDAERWAELRERQRGDIVVKVSGRPTDLPTLIGALPAGGSLVSRAALGLSWVSLPGPEAVAPLREALAPRACTVLDGADRVDDPWPTVDPGALAVMRRVKQRFDPAGSFRPGTFVGGL
ncbi:MAG TPA: FAD-binding oxidoreductase [Solirubrobacteraceae bacterium]|nr:FAD-binding oxidoreductase [Solirubrobacteraceae bacterium]